MANSILFAAFIILILSALYIMKGGENSPETHLNQAPKVYSEVVEQKRAAQQAAEKMQQSLQQSAERSDKALESIGN
jgi:hypothetical protein